MKYKKSIGIALAVVLVLCSVIIGVAYVIPENGNYDVSVNILSDVNPIPDGGSVRITVTVDTNFTVGTLSIPLFYEKNKIESVTNIPASEGAYKYSTSDISPDAERIFQSAGLSADNYGFVMITYIPAKNSPVDRFIGKEVLSFTLNVKEGAEGTVKLATYEASRKTESNGKGTLYIGSIDSDILDSVPVNVEKATGLVTSKILSVGVIPDPELVPETPEGTESGGVVAADEGFVYGIEVGADVEEFFRVKDGKMAVVANSAGYTNGTGTKVQVYTNDDKLVAEYTLVVFGDVDGDGVLSTADAIKIKQYAGGDHEKIASEAALLAADVDSDTALSTADAIKIKQYAGGDHSKVSQTR